MLWTMTREYVRGRVVALAGIVVLQLIQTLSSLFLPSLNARIIDEGISAGNLALIWRIGFVMVAVAAVQALCSAGAIFLAARTAMGQGQWLRERVFRHVQAFSSADMRAFGAPSLITRCTNDVQQIQMVVFLIYEIMLVAPLMGIGGVVMAVREDVPLSGLLLVVVPVLAVSVGIIMARLSPRFKAQQKAIDALTDIFRSQLAGVRVIRAFRRQGTERRRYGEANERLRGIALSIGALFALMFPVVQLIVTFSQVAVVWVGAGRIEAGAMDVGSLTAFLNYLILILMSVMMGSFVFTMIPRAQVCAQRIGDVLAHEPTVEGGTRHVHGPLRVRLEGAEVRYGDAAKPVLAALDLEFKPGETTAIIGSTGSGKSTLVSLLPRLRDPSSGRVSVNGEDAREVDLDELRRRIAYVPQRAYLFSGTIAQTVAASEPAEPLRVWRALRAAQAEDFVRDLPQGIDTRVEAGGSNFSGGQRQRLAIARALYRMADLYVFDDAFSALDYATDAALRSGLRDHVGPDAAVVIVAQRIATIRHASTIVVLEHGRVVGRGNHDQLVASCETYREIVRSQTEEAA